MSETIVDDVIDDLEQCAREGRRPRGRAFRVRINDDRFTLRDPVPTGRQLLDVAGRRPVENILIYLVLPGRQLEGLRLDETVDLREKGVERFLVFESDRAFFFTLDGRRIEWGASEITGLQLKWLAGVDPKTHGVWLERTEEPDLLIPNDGTARLAEDGVERFRTAQIFFVCVEDEILPWPRSTIMTEEIAQLGGWDISQGVIEVDEEQNERSLEPGEVIELKPGLAFGKRLCWKRG